MKYLIFKPYLILKNLVFFDNISNFSIWKNRFCNVAYDGDLDDIEEMLQVEEEIQEELSSSPQPQPTPTLYDL